MRLNTLTDLKRWPPEVTVESRFKLGGHTVSVTSLDKIPLAVFMLILNVFFSMQNCLYYWS